MQPTRITIPKGITFADLDLRRESDGAVSFSTATVARICEASGIDPDDMLSSEDATSAFVVAWYKAHLARGGAPDATAEDLIAEARIEGGRGSHEPGRA